MQKLIGIIGSRTLPEEYKGKVKDMVKYLLGKGYDIASGGAIGADAYALDALLELGQAHRGVIFSPWKHVIQFPETVQPMIQKFLAEGGRVEWGEVPCEAGRNAVVAGLLHRNIRLTQAVYGLVAYLCGPSRGTNFTLRRFKGKKLVYSYSVEGGARPALDGACPASHGGFQT